MPGYTHLQRAQPVLAAHYALAYVEKLERDRSRVADCRARLNQLPLGAAALAGTTFEIDRQFVARELGFDGVAANSLDVSSDRDFALEAVFTLTVIATHLAGWAEEWVLWSTQEFGFLALPDAVCTGSSIMPQKKNPDVCELIRGRSARVVGDLTTLLVLVKGLPLAYNRDLQEDKEPIFDAFDTVNACLDLAAVVVEGASLRADRIQRTPRRRLPRRHDSHGIPDLPRAFPSAPVTRSSASWSPSAKNATAAWPTSRPTTSPRSQTPSAPTSRTGWASKTPSTPSAPTARPRPAQVEKQLAAWQERRSNASNNPALGARHAGYGFPTMPTRRP